MMSIADEARYLRHRTARDAQSGGATALHEFLLPMLLFGSMGAITWAIRGTDGYGGVDGTIVPGLMWGLLWYYLCWRKGIDARGVVFWLGMGIALGGELGYGQYVSWIQGNFKVASEVIAVSPWQGYKWFMLCGIGWAAPGGILLGWALSNRVSAGQWALRAALLVLLLVVLFADLVEWPVIAWFGGRFRGACPGLLFPNAHLGLYGGELRGDLARTVRTNTQNFLVVLWWVSALVVAGIKRDKATLVPGLVIGGGFGIGFMLSALWCLGYAHAPDYIDWWKMWELNAGFNLGLLYVLTLNWAIRQTDKAHSKGGATTGAEPPSAPIQWRGTPFLAVGGSALLFLTGYEHFYWTGVGLAVFWAVALCLATFRFGRADGTDGAAARRRGVSLVYAAFLYLFILVHGGTSRAGVLLELYKAENVGQYAWPGPRIALFAPVAAVLSAGAVFKMWQATRPDAGQRLSTPARLPARMMDLMTVTGFVGALTIWPSEIGVLYALFLCFAFAAFMRINRRLDAVDTREGCRVGPALPIPQGHPKA